jgi:Restriction endonuclease
MTAIDVKHVAALLRVGDTATSNSERGRALEDLIAYLFELIPGISVTARNELNAFGAEEIDVAFWNEGDPEGLRNFDHLILVECKNWTAPVGYPELAIFLDKLQSRGRPLGILVAAHGITGEAADLTAAHSVLARALSQGREILVITRQEIEHLMETAQLVDLLKRKRAQLAVSGTIYEVDRIHSLPSV